MDILGGHDKIGLVLGVSSMYFMVFSYGKCTECFLGRLMFPDIFWRQTVDAGPHPTYEEKVRVPPPPPPHTHTGS